MYFDTFSRKVAIIKTYRKTSVVYRIYPFFTRVCWRIFHFFHFFSLFLQSYLHSFIFVMVVFLHQCFTISATDLVLAYYNLHLEPFFAVK